MAQMVKSLPAMWETWVRSLGQEDPWRRKWQPTPIFLPGKSHGWRSLAGYIPRGGKESDTTERLHFHFLSHIYICTYITVCCAVHLKLIQHCKSIILQLLTMADEDVHTHLLTQPTKMYMEINMKTRNQKK